MYIKIEQSNIKEFGVEIQKFFILSDQTTVTMNFQIVGNKVKVI